MFSISVANRLYSSNMNLYKDNSLYAGSTPSCFGTGHLRVLPTPPWKMANSGVLNHIKRVDTCWRREQDFSHPFQHRASNSYTDNLRYCFPQDYCRLEWTSSRSCRISTVYKTSSWKPLSPLSSNSNHFILGMRTQKFVQIVQVTS